MVERYLRPAWVRHAIWAMRAHTLLVAVTYALIAWRSSTVDLGLITGVFARHVMGFYAAVSLALVWDPLKIGLHRLALPLATLVSVGRVSAFSELVFRFDRWDLTGTLVLRVLIAGWVIGFHAWPIFHPAEDHHVFYSGDNRIIGSG